jgi:ATP-binding cassette subfamily B protein
VNIDRLEDMKDFPSLADEQLGIKQVQTFDSLKFDGVSYRYYDKPEEILKNCSFSLAKEKGC